ncbi:MAG: rod shape-determining protein MreD [Bacillota bacterium]
MPALILLAFFALALFLEGTLCGYIRIAGVKPDLVLVLVIFHALARGPREGAIWGFIGGLTQDIMTGNYVGLNALVKALTGYGVGLGETRLYKESTLTATGIAWLATLFAEALTYLLLLTLGIIIPPGDAATRVILPVSIYNAALAVLFYRRFYFWETRGFLRPR